MRVFTTLVLIFGLEGIFSFLWIDPDILTDNNVDAIVS